jgi:transposase-like protein
MAKKRKVHSPAFKAQVALAAHKGDKTINELAGHYSVHPTLIHGWKKHLVAGAEGLFAGPAAVQAASADAEARQAELFEQIGRLKMELEWIKKGRDPLSAMPQVLCTAWLAPAPHGARGTPPTGR